MQYRTLAFVLLLCAGLLLAPPVGADKRASGGQEADKATSKAPRSGSSTSEPVMIASMPVFVPKNRGSPLSRMGGATRSGRTDALPRIEAMVPEEAGWTLLEQPVLYWYTSRDVTSPVEVVVEAVDGPLAPPIVDTRLKPPFKAGLHALRLSYDREVIVVG